VVALPGEYSLTPTGEWDTLGLRGTVSRPGTLVADVPAHHVIGDYGTVFVRTALPVSTVMLNSVWLGLAEAAAAGAHRAVRAKARSRPAVEGAPPPLAATRLAELGVLLHQIRDAVHGAADRYEAAKDSDELETMRFTGRMDSVKLTASTRLIEVALGALAI
jgi:acyl-CoA dehydrogenase